MIRLRLSSLVALAVLSSLSTPVGYAQNTATTSSTNDQHIEQEELARLDQLFAAAVQEGNVVGCQAIVCFRNEVCYFKSFGQLDRDQQRAMPDDAIFRIYSMTKPITSVAALMLVERDKLELDAPVSKYLPAFKELKVLEEDQDAEGGYREVAPKRPMTVRDLLRHTSGLTYGFFGDTPVDQRYRQAGILSRDKDLAELVEKLAKIPLLYHPGERFHYSVSTDVLGRVVEVASGKSLKDFFADEIFEPLKMQDTFFTVPQERQTRLAEMYARREGKLRPASELASWRFLYPNQLYSGGGGLCSTTADYLRFCQMLLNEGEFDGTRLLAPETVEMMTQNQLPQEGSFRFGLGVSIDAKGRYGWGGAAGTRFWIDPQAEVIGIFMVQINPYRGPNYEQQMKRIVDEALRD